jgi:Ni/Fe-hydrogenase subunit HybB-like protein
VGGGAYWAAVVVMTALAVAGLGALVRLLGTGPQPYPKWGYTAAVLAFLISTFQAAPITAFATRMTRGYWGIPLRRAAELGALSSLVTTPLLILMLLQLPDFRGRPSIWFDWPGGPRLWDALAGVVFTLTGLALLYVSSLPDIVARSNTPQSRASLGWSGTTRQWQVLQRGVIVLGAFYLMMFVFVNLVVVSDLAMSLVPNWHSAIIPPYHAISGLEAGVATTLLTLAAFRRPPSTRSYIGLDPFWGASKLLLPFALLFFYFTWSELLTNWYGRMPDEQQIFFLFMFGPYLWAFVLSFGLNFVLPFVLLIWNPIRVSIAGPTAVSALVVLGNLVDRVRIYVPAWSVAGPVGQNLDQLPLAQLPGVEDVLIVVGAIALVVLLYLLALRVLPPISVWEYRQGMLLSLERPFLRTGVRAIAKPH